MSTFDLRSLRLGRAEPTHFCLAAAIALSSSGCGAFSLSTVTGGEKTGTSGASDDGAEQGQGSSGSARSEKGGAAANDSRNAAIDANLVKLLGDEARFSAAAVQTGKAPLCPTMADRAPVAVMSFDKDRDVDCFLFSETDRMTKPESYGSIREFQDNHTLQPAVVSLPSKKHDGVFVRVSQGTFVAVDESGKPGELRVLTIACNDEAKNLDSDFVLGHMSTLCDPSRASFDLLTTDADAAKSASLEDGKAKLTDAAMAAAKARADEVAKADAEALKKVRFPAIVSVDGAADAVKAAREVAGKKESGIDPSAIKRAAVTSPWQVDKDLTGQPVRRTVDVTIGFARTDAYAADPNKKCAFTTFEVEQKRDGAGWSVAYATGMGTKWTHIACDRL